MKLCTITNVMLEDQNVFAHKISLIKCLLPTSCFTIKDINNRNFEDFVDCTEFF